jgi:hypothetical protein
VTGPYASAAAAYWDAGWRGVLPLPERRKAHPRKGFTGHGGAWPSRGDVQAWSEGGEGVGNIALRMPPDVIGIDVDAYGDKQGAATLKELVAEWGPLPATWRSTSRDDAVSGIYLFRVPVGLAWPGEAGSGVEIIQTAHRYAVVWPSVHPEGRVYRWVGPDGHHTEGMVPRPAALPLLPLEWIQGLSGGTVREDVAHAGLDASGVAAWLAEHGAGEPCAEMARCLAEYSAEGFVGTGSRHDPARDATHRLIRLAGEGHSGATVALGQMKQRFDAAVQADPRRPRDPGDWRRLCDGAVQLAAAGPAALRDPCDAGVVLEAVDEFWTARPDLALIHSAARAALCSPWALLGAVLARLITAVPKHIVLPGLVGTQASLNLFVALVGESGSGKGAAMGVAAELLDVEHIETATIGSGEGLAHLFARRVKTEVERTADAVLLDVAEVDTLAALTSRQGATLLPELRKGWMGERLGFSYADPTKRLPIARHDYRLCMVVGVQPGRARALLDDSDGGTPQRFLWLPTTDPGVPEFDTVKPAERLTWRAIDLGVEWAVHHGRREMIVPAAVAAEVRGAQRDRLRGVGDALDGHALLARLKVAAALALLDKRMAIADEDWRLAGVVMGVSDATRASVGATLAAQNRETNRARGKAEGERAVLVADAVDGRKVARVARRLVVILRKDQGWMRHGILAHRIAYRDRPLVDDAIEAALSAGQIEADLSDPEQASYRARVIGS